MKKLLLISAVLFIVFAVGCNQNATNPNSGGNAPGGASKKRVGVTLLTREDDFYRELEAGLSEAAEKNNFELIVQSGDKDLSKQQSQIDNFLVQKVDAIIVSPTDTRGIAPAIERANAANIPVFTADIAAGGGAVVSHIASDNAEGGRLAAEYIAKAIGGSHIPKALNVGLGSSFPTWAGTVLPADTPYLLVLEKAEDLWNVCWELLRIGYDLPEGWLAGGMMNWRTAAKPLESLPQWTVWELREQMEKDKDLIILDVRQPQEWANGHIEKAIHITGAELPERYSEIPEGKQVAVICGSGFRSSVAGSLLKNKNYRKIASVIGGMSAWKKADFPTV